MTKRWEWFWATGMCSFVAMFVSLCSGCSGVDWTEKPPDQSIQNDRLYVDARAALLQAANSNDPYVRAHAIEAIAQTLKASSAAYLMQGLSDKSVIVRYAAAMGLGDIKYKSAKKKLIELVDNPKTDERVVCAAIYALYQIGEDQFAYQLGVVLSSRFELGRASAAQAMGKMGEKSAIGPLKTALGYEPNDAAKISMVEALALLGDKQSQLYVEGYAQSYYLDMRLPAIPILAKLKTPKAQLVLTSLLADRNPPRIRVAAAGGLGYMGLFDEKGYKLCLAAAENPHKVLQGAFPKTKESITSDVASSLQRLAAMALGDIQCAGSLRVLQNLLQSNDGSVRVAAAWAILQMLEPKTVEVHQVGHSEQHPTDGQIPPDGQTPPAEKIQKLPDMESADGIDLPQN